MRKVNFYAGAFVWLLLISGSLLGQGFTPGVTTRFQYVLDSFVNASAVPYVGGVAVAIDVDGLSYWEGASGYASRSIDNENNLLPGGIPFTTANSSRIYSVTKMVTAPLVLELAREHFFSLDDAVSRYFPIVLVNPALDPAVTIRQLLAHESGYSDYTTEYMLQVSVAFLPSKVWTPAEAVSFVHQVAPKGTLRRYSSTNYILLGAIIENATGKPVEQLYRERFFNKLGLHSMYLGVREAPVAADKLADPHDNLSQFNPVFQQTGLPLFPDAYTNIRRFPMTAIVSLAFTGGGLVSNVRDLAKWGNSLFGYRATSRATVDSMIRSIFNQPDPDGDYLGYGLWTNSRISSTDLFYIHNGNSIGYRALLIYQPDRKMSIAVICNFKGTDPYTIARVLYASLPQFLCGNNQRKDPKIQLCYKGQTLCVDRHAADQLIRNGAKLGACVLHYPCSDGEQEHKDWSHFRNDLQFTAYPNPFAERTTLSFKAPENGTFELRIFTMQGKLIATLYSGVLQKGSYRQVEFYASQLPNGVYLGQLKTGKGIAEIKLIVHK